jgi:poly(beta-D-mannuronate) lyase
MRVGICCLLCAVGPLTAREVPVADLEALEKACAAAQPGDVLIMSDGRWKDAEILFRANGTSEAPVTLRAQTPGKVILCGASSLRFIGSHLVVDGLVFQDGFVDSGHVIAFRGDSDEEATDCRLTNTAIIAYNPPAGNETSTKWVSLYGVRNRVDHCFFQGKADRDQVITVWLNGRPNDHRIDWNYFGDRPALGKNGGEIIRVGDSKTSMEVSRTIVEHNLFERCDGEAEIVSNKSCENVYRHNTFRESSGALTLRHGNNCLVESNFFFGGGKSGSGGVRITGEGHRVWNNYFTDLLGEEFFSAIGFMAGIPDSEPSGYLQIKKAVVAFNTVVNCRSSLYFGIGFGSRGRELPAVDCVIANNVIVNAGHSLVTTKAAPVNARWEGNFFLGNLEGLPADASVSTQDPLLEREANGLWQPGSGSPVLGAAKGRFPEVTVDILGRSRSTPRTSGSLQPSAAPSRFPPLARRDVGPAWMKSE